MGWLAAPDEQVVYSNPYYEPVATESASYLNYAQPIATPTPVTVDVPVEVPVDVQVTVPDKTDAAGAGLDDAQKSAQDQAVELFDQASAAFQDAKYSEAQRLVEQAISKLPGDTTLHEFRALTLFAQKKYKEAAGAIYAVLAAGPGWDWQSLKSFYPDVKTYTAQLRDLEQFQRANPTAAYASLLLAYHYITLEYVDEAIKQLQNALKAEPKDELSKHLLAALQKADVSEERPRPKAVSP
jgi:tetratricopeptide (TPR) repeat protein